MPLKATESPSTAVAGKEEGLSRWPKFTPKIARIDPAATTAGELKFPAFTTALIVGIPWPIRGRVTVLLVLPPISRESGCAPTERLGGTEKDTRYVPTCDGSRADS